MNDNNKIIIYQTEDGQTLVDVRMENDTVWLTQAQMAELNGVGLPPANIQNCMQFTA